MVAYGIEQQDSGEVWGRNNRWIQGEGGIGIALQKS